MNFLSVCLLRSGAPLHDTRCLFSRLFFPAPQCRSYPISSFLYLIISRSLLSSVLHFFREGSMKTLMNYPELSFLDLHNLALVWRVNGTFSCILRPFACLRLWKGKENLLDLTSFIKKHWDWFMSATNKQLTWRMPMIEMMLMFPAVRFSRVSKLSPTDENVCFIYLIWNVVLPHFHRACHKKIKKK